MTSLQTEPWTRQVERWPRSGRHILAQYDDASIVVYQAYRLDLAEWAVEHQRFGGSWSFKRMTWIKPNFLWMMFRCGWARKENQERVLAIRLGRETFDQILSVAMSSSAPEGVTAEEWSRRLQASDVRLQWDPDHGPGGERQARRAIQLGLRREAASSFATEWILSIEDITPLVHEQLAVLESRGISELLTPLERVYVPESQVVRSHLRLDS